jgi:hypothetical protein
MTYRAQKVDDRGIPDAHGFQDVPGAHTPKQAAEKLYGGPLNEIGLPHQLRVLVLRRGGTTTPFYAR